MKAQDKKDQADIQGVQVKLCFFHNSAPLAYIAARDLQSFQRNASVQSLL